MRRLTREIILDYALEGVSTLIGLHSGEDPDYIEHLERDQAKIEEKLAQLRAKRELKDQLP